MLRILRRAMDNQRPHPLTREVWISIGLLFALFAGRALYNEVVLFSGGEPDWMFGADPTDRFADLIKSALSFRSISLQTTRDDFSSWPDIFQRYFLQNPYDGPILSHFHNTPLTTLGLMTVAKVLVVVNPTFALMAMFVVYALAAFLLARWYGRLVGSEPHLALAAFLLLLSYPAVFMALRGNFSSGFTSLGLVAYVFTVAFRRGRWFGLFCLAVAVCIRPNVAVVAAIELVYGRTNRERLLGLVKGGLLSLLVWALAFALTNTIYPSYTLSRFLEGTAIYHRLYAQGPSGLGANSSLYAATRLIRIMAGLNPPYHPTLYALVTALAVIVACIVGYAFWARRVHPVESIFVTASFTALFTPVYATYHTLVFAIPLLCALALSKEEWLGWHLRRVVCGACLFMLFPSTGLYFHNFSHVAVMLAVNGIILARAVKAGGLLKPAAREAD